MQLPHTPEEWERFINAGQPQEPPKVPPPPASPLDAKRPSRQPYAVTITIEAVVHATEESHATQVALNGVTTALSLVNVQARVRAKKA